MGHKRGCYLSIALGFWLVISAYVWPHSSAQLANAWISGLLAVNVAAVAIASPDFRFVNTALGIWLVISPFALPRMSAATAWNNVLIGVAIALISLVGPGRTVTRRRVQSRRSDAAVGTP